MFPYRHLLMVNPIYCISISVSLRILPNTPPPPQELLCSGTGVHKSSAICFRVNENNGNLLCVVKSFHSLRRWARKFRLSSKNESAGENYKVLAITVLALSWLYFLGIAVKQQCLQKTLVYNIS